MYVFAVLSVPRVALGVFKESIVVFADANRLYIYIYITPITEHFLSYFV